MKYKKVYLDTPVVRDCLKRRKSYSILLLKFLKENNIKCITGIFTDLELLDIEQETFFFNREMQGGEELNTVMKKRGEKNLNEEELNKIRNSLELFYTEYDFIEKVALVDEGWQWALNITMTSNIRSEDALHLATAIGQGCDLLVTNDGHFIKEAKNFLVSNSKELEICHAKEAKKIVEDS